MKLRDHADEIKALHLRDLIQDPARCEALTAEFNGIVLDYSRQNVTTATMVSMTSSEDQTDHANRIFCLTWQMWQDWISKE
jgi:glucose-6-phosphate isomerase